MDDLRQVAEGIVHLTMGADLNHGHDPSSGADEALTRLLTSEPPM